MEDIAALSTTAQPQPQTEIKTYCHEIKYFLGTQQSSSPTVFKLEVDFSLKDRRPVYSELYEDDSSRVYEVYGSSNTVPTVELNLDHEDNHNPDVMNALRLLGVEESSHDQVLQDLMTQVEQVLTLCRNNDLLRNKGLVTLQAAVDINRFSNMFENGQLVGQADDLFNQACLELALRGLVKIDEGEMMLDDQKNCVICLDALFNDKVKEEEDGAAMKLPNCRHVFHRSCITEWLKKTRSCPLCRSSCLPRA